MIKFRQIVSVALAAIVICLCPITASADWEKTKDGKTYYTENNKKLYGFQTIDGATYYFDKSGYMTTGKVKIGSYTYSFGKDGKMFTGWEKTKSGDSYYYTKDGKRAFGFNRIDSKVYYFSPSNGKMLKSGSYKIDGVTFTFDKNGQVVAEKNSQAKKLAEIQKFSEDTKKKPLTPQEFIAFVDKNGDNLFVEKDKAAYASILADLKKLPTAPQDEISTVFNLTNQYFVLWKGPESYTKTKNGYFEKTEENIERMYVETAYLMAGATSPGGYTKFYDEYVTNDLSDIIYIRSKYDWHLKNGDIVPMNPIGYSTVSSYRLFYQYVVNNKKSFSQAELLNDVHEKSTYAKVGMQFSATDKTNFENHLPGNPFFLMWSQLSFQGIDIRTVNVNDYVFSSPIYIKDKTWVLQENSPEDTTITYFVPCKNIKNGEIIYMGFAKQPNGGYKIIQSWISDYVERKDDGGLILYEELS
jgi:hypothetical protein